MRKMIPKGKEMRRALCVAVLSVTALTVSAPVALAGPAVDVPPAACNQGTERAYETANWHSNSPVGAHGHHDGCHVHLPS